MTKKLTPQQVVHVADLAKLDLSPEEVARLSSQLTNILDLIDQIQKLPTGKVGTTSQVTGLTNVFREDKIDKSRMLSQEEALANAQRVHNGYFIVPNVFGETK